MNILTFANNNLYIVVKFKLLIFHTLTIMYNFENMAKDAHHLQAPLQT